MRTIRHYRRCRNYYIKRYRQTSLSLPVASFIVGAYLTVYNACVLCDMSFING